MKNLKEQLEALTGERLLYLFTGLLTFSLIGLGIVIHKYPQLLGIIFVLFVVSKLVSYARELDKREDEELTFSLDKYVALDSDDREDLIDKFLETGGCTVDATSQSSYPVIIETTEGSEYLFKLGSLTLLLEPHQVIDLRSKMELV